MKCTIKSFIVVNCNNEVVAMDSAFGCSSLAHKMNKGKNYINKPYSVKWVDTTLETSEYK